MKNLQNFKLLDKSHLAVPVSIKKILVKYLGIFYDANC